MKPADSTNRHLTQAYCCTKVSKCCSQLGQNDSTKCSGRANEKLEHSLSRMNYRQQGLVSTVLNQRLTSLDHRVNQIVDLDSPDVTSTRCLRNSEYLKNINRLCDCLDRQTMEGINSFASTTDSERELNSPTLPSSEKKTIDCSFNISTTSQTQAKESDNWRKSYFRKLAQRQILKCEVLTTQPTEKLSKSEFNETDAHLVIFDWDNTLYPTSFICKLQYAKLPRSCWPQSLVKIHDEIDDSSVSCH